MHFVSKVFLCFEFTFFLLRVICYLTLSAHWKRKWSVVGRSPSCSVRKHTRYPVPLQLQIIHHGAFVLHALLILAVLWSREKKRRRIIDWKMGYLQDSGTGLRCCQSLWVSWHLSFWAGVKEQTQETTWRYCFCLKGTGHWEHCCLLPIIAGWDMYLSSQIQHARPNLNMAGSWTSLSEKMEGHVRRAAITSEPCGIPQDIILPTCFTSV